MLTIDEYRTLCEFLLDGVKQTRRFQRFIHSMKITDETNVIHRNLSDTIEELHDAFDFVQTLPIV